MDSLETGYLDIRIEDTSEAGERNQSTESNRGEETEMATDESTEVTAQEEGRNVRAKLSHPSSPRNPNKRLERPSEKPQPQPEIPGPKKTRVIVRDVAYTTYRAVLYYVRTFCVTLTHF